MKGGAKSIVMLNLCSTAARRLAKNSPLDYFCPATQCRSLCFSIYSIFFSGALKDIFLGVAVFSN